MNYSKDFHVKMKEFRGRHKGLELIVDGMELYLQNKPTGKLFHDPLASTTLIDDGVCNFKRVKVWFKDGEYGATLDENSDTIISVSVDKERFLHVLSCS